MQLIVCDKCGTHLHTDCVGLDESGIAELEREELDWICPGCRQFSGDHEYFASPSAPPASSGRSQKLEDLASPSTPAECSADISGGRLEAESEARSADAARQLSTVVSPSSSPDYLAHSSWVGFHPGQDKTLLTRRGAPAVAFESACHFGRLTSAPEAAATLLMSPLHVNIKKQSLHLYMQG